MKHLIALTAVVILIAGCASQEQKAAQQAAAEDAQCQSYGARPGTDAYIQCRLSLSQQHAQETRLGSSARYRPCRTTMPRNQYSQCQ